MTLPQPERALCLILARLLEYPGPQWPETVSSCEEALVELGGGRALRKEVALIQGFLQRVPQRTLGEWQELYVETFDFGRKVSLYWTAILFGEERDRTRHPQRGYALWQLQEIYRRYGYDLLEGELPDYLPALLEFVSQVGIPPELSRYMDVLQAAMKEAAGKLREAASPYEPLLAAAGSLLQKPALYIRGKEAAP
ncbi:MAG: nitrate reductase molybdenum cofactor assembly chaperone [Clostridiales bacterium]|nr:nitrate reductase molybdenum cofactor assembly chaperone [Clostridiales bacterium]